MTPRFSIITVTYNAAQTLPRTLQSLSRQEASYEYLVIDGGSSDGTLDLLEEHKSLVTKSVSEPDEGIYDAMNKGIRMAQGEWIGIINADDWYADDALAQVDALVKSRPDVDVVVGGMMRVAEDLVQGHLVTPPASFSCLKPNNHPATFVRRSVYEKLGSFDTRYQIAADLDFILRVQANSETKIFTTPTPLAYMRVGGASYGFAGVGEACRIEARYHGVRPAVRLFGRKVFQKTRALVAQRVLPASLYHRLQRRWWARRHAGSQSIQEEDVRI